MAINQYIQRKKAQTAIITLMLLFAACESDLMKPTIGEGTPPALSSSANELVLARTDSANVALNLSWTSPGYLENTEAGDVTGNYFVEIDQSEDFSAPKSFATGNNLQRSFTVYALNKIMLDLGYEADLAQNLFIRVKSVFFTTETLYSTTLSVKVTPYTTIIPPAIEVPEQLWISGDALPTGWNQPFLPEQQFSKETSTSFSITIDLLGGKDYEMITDGTGANWTPCYRIDPALDPATMVWGGSFVWDGEGSAYSWGSKKFLSPPNDGTYKITMDFQEATFKVEDVSGPPVIEVPAELWIYGDGLTGGWVTPFPAERQFEKISDTKFSITIFIAASTPYEMITDGTGANWTPCYRIDPALDPAEMIWGGSFVWDGEGSDYIWGSKKFLSPPDDGEYTITLDFQTATFVVATP
ncbi:MAG: SusE domain-containing protein [Prolixibacteraceae bacterium]|nr:SusE domain-containing protein [Prolixibacteraceae bacterium]